MLGKGLESLIPQKGSQNGGQGGDQNSQSQPQPQSQPEQKPQENFAASQLPIQAPPVQMISTEPAAPVQPIQPSRPVEQQQPARPIQLPAQSPVQQSPNLSKVFEEKVLKKEDDNEIRSVFQIEVDKIGSNPGQPRRHFDESALRELASSIREYGFLQPLVVSKIEKETSHGIEVEYQLIAGERRLLASKLLGLRLVPAIIRKVGLEREKIELAVIENIQRENLNPIETARAFQRLQEEFRMTQREIAAKLGKSREVVANTVRLLDLPAYIQESVQKNELSESHARLLLSVEDPAAQKRLFDDVLRNGLTTRDVKERVKSFIKPRAEHIETAEEHIPAEVRAMQESLSMELGAPVEIHKGANTGKITITFYSEEELENILRRLGQS